MHTKYILLYIMISITPLFSMRAENIEPTDLNSLLKRGKLYVKLKQLDQAIYYFKKVIEIKPNYEKGYLALGLILIKQGNFSEAEKIFTQLLKISPNNIDGMYELAYSLKMQGKQKKAIPYYEEVIRRKPDYNLAYFGLAKSYLAEGKFQNGWKFFEWRAADTQYIQKNHMLSLDTFKNKTILLRAEWGIGDFFQFIRYAEILKTKYNCKIILQTFKSLKPIFNLCYYIDTVITIHEKVPPFDIQVPLLSLPLLFKTVYETIPTNIPYLYADIHLIAYWRKKLETDPHFKIGLCWQAAPESALEKNDATRRSIPLTLFAQLADIKNISFYSLQKIHGLEQLYNMPKKFIIQTFDDSFDNKYGSFMDTAALIKNLDLVITVDTSIAHLAGALGAQVWVILPPVAEWRWLKHISSSPWYPNMHVFRQSFPGDFSNIIKEVKNRLSKLLTSQGEVYEDK